jgi:MFS family permease
MGISTKPSAKEHFEDVDLKRQEEATQDVEEIDINDVVQNKKLNRRLDLRVLPLCCWVYLLNFLDRGELRIQNILTSGTMGLQLVGNIGNARVLNAETNDDMLQVTGLTPHGYALTVTLFSVAYAVFEIPSNWVMKHYIRPSMWLGILLFAWGALTIGFAGVKNTATIIALRFLIGVFEAGFFPGASPLSECYHRDH